MKKFAKKIYMETGYYALSKSNKTLGAASFVMLLMTEVHIIWLFLSLAMLGFLFWCNMRCRNVKYAIILTLLHFILGVFYALGGIWKITNGIMNGHSSSGSSTQKSYEGLWAEEKAKKNEGVYGKDQDWEAKAMGFRDAEEAAQNNIDMGGKYYNG